MNAHALAVLEFDRVLALVAERCSSALGAARVRASTPTNARAWIEEEHARVRAMRALVGSERGWGPEPVPDLTAPLRRLRAAGSVWTTEELAGGALLLRSSRRTKEALGAAADDSVAVGPLDPIAARLVTAVEPERAIDRAIDPDGTVRDDASPALRRVRRELRGAEGDLVKLLERIMAGLDSHQRVPDMSVTVRNGRYVIPVRREGRGALGGIVHDESATRGTLFVEPPAAVEFGNRIRALQAEEAREIHRILRELTELLRPLGEALDDSLDALVELDSLYARARFADALGCAQPSLSRPGEGFAIRDGRHPLLVAQGGDVVPFDLEMTPEERTLLLSGPNTGGKTVLLKAIGLMSALVQAGVPAPVGAESRVAVFDDCFADVGDEQSIQASLSTFSAHLKNLGEILREAGPTSLVLIDELGSGTDPAEGAALGAAVLEALTRRGTQTIATTHLGTLKLLATELPGLVNASLQFDEAALAPTYRLRKGLPGRSYGLSIARRLRLPDDVLARAEERVPKGERDLAALLERLEDRDTRLAERERALAEDSARVERRSESLASRERDVREAQRALEREARAEARRYLLQARAEVEQVIHELRGAATERAEEVERDARRRVESLAAEHGDALAKLETDASADVAGDSAGTLRVDDRVAVESLGGRVGRLLELRDGEAVVALGAVKLTVPLGALRRAAGAPGAPTVHAPVAAAVPEVDAPSELDVRGMRVDEMEAALLHFVDAAVRADLKLVRIIHGKGTGALRERVAELLRGDRRVRGHRLGAWNEGGAGVTVAELA